MELRNNAHPVFVSGQYLTSEHLNGIANFLWLEEKATRYMFTGNGIARGFVPSISAAGELLTVALTAGTAVTIDGLIIEQAGNTRLTKSRPIVLVRFKLTSGETQLLDKVAFDKVKESLKISSSTELNGFELFPSTMKENELPEGTKDFSTSDMTFNDAKANYSLITVSEIKDEEYSQCEQGDCNTKGINRRYIIRYFLVRNNQFITKNVISDELSTTVVVRIKNLSDAGSKDGLNQKSFTAWSSSYAELAPYFGENLNRQLLNIAKILGKEEETALSKSTTLLNQINQSVNAKSCPQYYVQFAADLAKAINELVIEYNNYSRENPLIGGERIEGTIIVGSLESSSGIDKLRDYFMPAIKTLQGEKQITVLQNLFRRVLALVENFIPQTAITEKANTVQNRPLSIPTTVGAGPFQNSAIPYYYDIVTTNENTILKYWNPYGGNLKNVFSYYDSKAPSRTDMANKMPMADWTHFNFFRIEGHIGLNKQVAINAINALIRTQGIPIQLVDCDVNYKGPTKWINWYNQFQNNLGVWVKDLRKDYKAYDYSPIKKIQDTVNQTSYRNITEVAKAFNDFTAYSGVFYNAQVAAGAGAGASAASKGIPADAYTRYKQVVNKQQYEGIYQGFKDAVAEQNDLQAKKLVVLSDLVELEYGGGAPRGGTFVLLHDGQNVIGDGFLPYYYRINLARTYNE